MTKLFKIIIIFIVLVLLMVVFVVLKRSPEPSGELKTQLKLPGAMELTSSVFSNEQFIPKKYTCDGDNINPPLEIKGVPERAKSLVLLVDDPDAPMGTWDHWVVFNINPSAEKIEENSVPAGAVEGLNDFKKHTYGGPCPPSGTHRYYFKLYALDKKLDELSSTAKKEDVEKAMDGHILDYAELVGLYKR